MQHLCCPKLMDGRFGFERGGENGIGVLIVEKHYIFGAATGEIGKTAGLVAGKFACDFDGP